LTAVLRHAREVVPLVKECRRLAAELYSAGGATIETAVDDFSRRPEVGAPIAARTVVQPDGDVVCFATDRYCLDADLRVAHDRNVAAWYGRAESTLSEVVTLVRSLSRALGLAISLLAGGVATLTTSGVLRIVVPLIVVPLVFGAVRASARFGLRRLVSGVLGRR